MWRGACHQAQRAVERASGGVCSCCCRPLHTDLAWASQLQAPPPHPPHLQGRQVGDAHRVVLASVHHHQLPAPRGRPDLHAPALRHRPGGLHGGRHQGARRASWREWGDQQGEGGGRASRWAGGPVQRPACGERRRAAACLPSSLGRLPPLPPPPSFTSVVGRVTCGSAMPGLSFVTSAAGAALENMPRQLCMMGRAGGGGRGERGERGAGRGRTRLLRVFVCCQPVLPNEGTEHFLWGSRR